MIQVGYESPKLLRRLRRKAGLTQDQLGTEAGEFHKIATPDKRISKWESDLREFPHENFAFGVCQVLLKHGIDSAETLKLMEALKRDRALDKLEKRKRKLADEHNLIFLDSPSSPEYVEKAIDDWYAVLANAGTPLDLKVRASEHLLLLIPLATVLAPAIVPSGIEEDTALRFLDLRFQILGQLGERMIAGERITPFDIRLYHNPSRMPQLGIVSRPIERDHVDFQKLSNPVQEKVFDMLISRLKEGNWTEKSEAAFLLGHLNFIVPPNRRKEVARELVDAIDMSDCTKSLWFNWHCGTEPAKFSKSLAQQSISKLRHCSKRHPERISRMGARLFFPIEDTWVYHQFGEIIPAVYTSRDTAMGCEHVGCYAIFELCNISWRVFKDTGMFLPLQPFKSNLDAIREKTDWTNAQALVPWLVGAVEACFRPEDRLKIRAYA